MSRVGAPIGTIHTDHKGYRWIKTDKGWQLEHRVIAQQHLDRKLTTKDLVHHDNELRYDNNNDNLKIVSRSEHTRLHNLTRDNKGGTLQLAKLTKVQVLEILQLRSSGVKPKAIAKRFHITAAQVWNIVTGKQWKTLYIQFHEGNE